MIAQKVSLKLWFLSKGFVILSLEFAYSMGYNKQESGI